MKVKHLVSVICSVICSVCLTMVAVASPIATASQISFAGMDNNLMTLELSDDESDIDFSDPVSVSSKPSFLSGYITLPSFFIFSNQLSPKYQYGNGISDWNYTSSSSLQYAFVPSPISNLGVNYGYILYYHFHCDGGFGNIPSTAYLSTPFGSNPNFTLDNTHSSDTDLYYSFSYTSPGTVGSYLPSVSIAAFEPISGRTYCNVYVSLELSSSSISVDNSASIATGGSSSGGSVSRLNANKLADNSSSYYFNGLGQSLRNKA